MTRNAILLRIGQLFEITGSPYVANVADVYSYTFGTAGGTGPITWDCTPNPIGASGVSFSAGTLSGTVLAGGVTAFTLTATDANRQIAHATFLLITIGDQVLLITELSEDIITETGEAMIPE